MVIVAAAATAAHVAELMQGRFSVQFLNNSKKALDTTLDSEVQKNKVEERRRKMMDNIREQEDAISRKAHALSRGDHQTSEDEMARISIGGYVRQLRGKSSASRRSWHREEIGAGEEDQGASFRTLTTPDHVGPPQV